MRITDKKLSRLEKFKNIIAKNALNIPARSSLYFTATNLIAKCASFIFTPIFTRILLPGEYGEFSLFSTYLSVAIVLVTLELPGGVIMRAFQKYKSRASITVLIASFLTSLAAPVVTLMLFVAKSVTGKGLSFNFAYLFLLISLFSISINNLYISKCKFGYKWLPSLAIAVIQSVITPVLSILLIKIDYFSAYGHVSLKIGIATAVTFLISGVLLLLTVIDAKKEIKKEKMNLRDIYLYSKEVIKLLFRLSLPLLPYYFSVMMISQADKLYVSSFFGSSTLGKYSVAYSAGIALTAVTGGITGALCPWIMRKVRESETEKVRDTLSCLISALVPFFIAYLTLAPEIFRILAPAEYSDALPVLFISTVIPIPLALTQCMSSVAIANERVFGVLLSGILSLVLSASLGAIFIPGGNLSVAAAITASGFTFLLILEAVNIKKTFGKSIIKVNTTLQNFMILIFSAALIFTLRNQFTARLILLLIDSLYLLYTLKRSSLLLTEVRKNGA